MMVVITNERAEQPDIATDIWILVHWCRCCVVFLIGSRVRSELLPRSTEPHRGEALHQQHSILSPSVLDDNSKAEYRNGFAVFALARHRKSHGMNEA